MLSDPISITVSGTPHSMPRVSSTGQSSLYKKSDSTFRLEVSHSINNGTRQRNTIAGFQKVPQVIKKALIRFVNRKLAADPITAINDFEEARISVIFERPEGVFTNAELDAAWTGFKAWLVTATLDKVLAEES